MCYCAPGYDGADCSIVTNSPKWGRNGMNYGGRTHHGSFLELAEEHDQEQEEEGGAGARLLELSEEGLGRKLWVKLWGDEAHKRVEMVEIQGGQ